MTPCGIRGQKYNSQPIPLMKSNYLSEFRTALEKAKARKNLGIGDEYNLTWGNITGHIEDNADLIRFIEQQWQYSYVSPYIQQQINTVKDALDYALYYVSTYEANDQAVQSLSRQFDELSQQVTELNQELSQDIQDNAQSIESIQTTIDNINQAISGINEALVNINVDQNIFDWIQNNLASSKTLELHDYVEIDENENETHTYVIEAKISSEEGNALEAKLDGLFVENLKPQITQIEQDITEIKETQEEFEESLKDTKYNTELPDSTESPIHQGVTVEQLKNKNLTEILDTILFPAAVRELVLPYVTQDDSITLLEVGSFVSIPNYTYVQGDAGETISTEQTLTFGGNPYAGSTYIEPGAYLFGVTVSYEAGDYLVNNRGETTETRVEAGSVNSQLTIYATYPWYAGNTSEGLVKQQLVRINNYSGWIEFPLSGKAVIKLPGSNTTLSGFQVNSGLGFLDVDLDGWDYTTEQLNGIPYKVWTKQDNYAAILPHKINFIIRM